MQDNKEPLTIRLTQGYYSLVDAEDSVSVNQYKWFAQVVRRKDGSISKVYAQRADWSGRISIRIMHHRFVLGLSGRYPFVDHINHNGLDNRKSNLRTCDVSENARHSRTPVNNTSGFKGVQKHGPSWIARISIGGKQKNLGCYPTPEMAAKVYNRAATELFGEFAGLNQINGG